MQWEKVTEPIYVSIDFSSMKWSNYPQSRLWFFQWSCMDVRDGL